ncbi:hypothetical protein FJZ41_04000 [Candidatus Shapirobacteria bacterium]|nr:hypothetical protein [Candidatus Shapirobacteria bacterium]
MDIFEKQQTIESIKAVVKARWFFASIVFAQGLLVKFLAIDVPLATTFQLSLILVGSYFYNFGYWLYLRRPPEKISSFWLKTIKVLQIALDQLAVSAILYFSGTVDKQVVVMYFISLMIGISLYGKKGIILSALGCSFLYSGLLILEYYGLLSAVQSLKFFTPGLGDLELVKLRMIGFNAYVISAAFFAWFISNVFRVREKRLIGQKDELTVKANILSRQTQELTQTKDYLHEALTKSDKARIDLEKTRTELQKANLELQAKVRELEKYGEVTTGRELKMIELKEEIKKLRETIENLKGQSASSR